MFCCEETENTNVESMQTPQRRSGGYKLFPHASAVTTSADGAVRESAKEQLLECLVHISSV